jgi:hypothetical protein
MGKSRKILAGFAAGAAATVPMTVEFWLAWRAGLLDEIPPHKAIRSVTARVPEPRLSVMSAIAHLAVGALAGVVYGAVVPSKLTGPIGGALFGVGVWVVGYEAVMPAATDIEPAHRDQRKRAATIFVAHLIYGATTGWLVSLAARQDTRTPTIRTRRRCGLPRHI